MHYNEDVLYKNTNNIKPIIIEDIDKTSLHESRMICVELKPSCKCHPFNKDYPNPDRSDSKE